ncbi:hypothetical protein ACLOJK_017289 [Asimina triloba]
MTGNSKFLVDKQPGSTLIGLPVNFESIRRKDKLPKQVYIYNREEQSLRMQCREERASEKGREKEKMSEEEVILLDFWVSPFAARAKLAFALKGIEFEAREEDVLGNKSELLLTSNPIYKKVPVLIHNGKPVCESVIILYYIEEAWPSSAALLPACAYARSQARFWADYIDKKVFETGSKIWKSKGEAQKEAVKDFIEILKVLEGALGDKDFFGGDDMGFTDVVAIPLTSWFYAYEQCGGFKLEDECPKFTAWMNRCNQNETVAKLLPHPTKVYEFVQMVKKMFGIE